MNRIKELRKARNLTMGELSNLSGIPVSTIGAYEKRGAHPRPDNASKLAEVFDVSVAYLLGYDETSPEARKNLYYSALKSDQVPLKDKWAVVDEFLADVKNPYLLEKVARYRHLLDPLHVAKLLNIDHALREVAVDDDEINTLIHAYIFSKV